jgi:hypothetical protein
LPADRAHAGRDAEVLALSDNASPRRAARTFVLAPRTNQPATDIPARKRA